MCPEKETWESFDVRFLPLLQESIENSQIFAQRGDFCDRPAAARRLPNADWPGARGQNVTSMMMTFICSCRNNNQQLKARGRSAQPASE